MLDGLTAILNIIPRVDDFKADDKMGAVSVAISEFVIRFP
jgi:hypothetical protein